MEGHHEPVYDEPIDDSAYNQEHDGKQRAQGKYTATKEPLPYALPLSIIVAAVIIAGAIMVTGRGSSGGSGKKLTAQVADNAAVDVKDVA